jgi:hypothetical protein
MLVCGKTEGHVPKKSEACIAARREMRSRVRHLCATIRNRIEDLQRGYELPRSEHPHAQAAT